MPMVVVVGAYCMVHVIDVTASRGVSDDNPSLYRNSFVIMHIVIPVEVTAYAYANALRYFVVPGCCITTR